MTFNSFYITAAIAGDVASCSEDIGIFTNRVSRVRAPVFTSPDCFLNFPMDEVSLSLQSGDVSIPTHLQTADELDEWLMSQ